MNPQSPFVSGPGSVSSDDQALQALLNEVTALAAGLRKVGPSKRQGETLPLGEISVLEILQKLGPQTVPQLARARSTSRQNIQIIVNRLGAAGFVQTTANPAHKRSPLVCMTETGRRLLRVGITREAMVLKKIGPQVSGEEVNSAALLLSRIRTLLNPRELVATPMDQPAAQNENKPLAPEPSKPQQAKAPEHWSQDDTEMPVNLL